MLGRRWRAEARNRDRDWAGCLEDRARTTFNTDAHDPARVDRVLACVHADGYNTVRVFLNGTCLVTCLGKPGGRLRPAYIRQHGRLPAPREKRIRCT